MEPWRGERKSVKRAGLEISGSINLWNETERDQQGRARARARGSIQMRGYSGDVALVINHSDRASVWPPAAACTHISVLDDTLIEAPVDLSSGSGSSGSRCGSAGPLRSTGTGSLPSTDPVLSGSTLAAADSNARVVATD